MGAGDSVTVFDEPVFGEEGYVPRPPPVFDGVGGLPMGWSKLTVPYRGAQRRGYMSDAAAVMPTDGGWYICPVRNGRVSVMVSHTPVFNDHVAAIVAAEMMFPRR